MLYSTLDSSESVRYYAFIHLFTGYNQFTYTLERENLSHMKIAKMYYYRRLRGGERLRIGLPRILRGEVL